MFTTITTKRAGLALILATTAIGAAGAQAIPPDTRRTSYCSGGLFTLTGGPARFHIALDDNTSEPNLVVQMKFINQNGTVVKVRTVTIGPGGSATLEHRGSGLFRVQAETFEFNTNINLSERRTVLGSLEVPVTISDLGGGVIGRLIGPGPWSQCVRTEGQ